MLQFAARNPQAGLAPSTALTRLRVAALSVLVVTTALAGLVALPVGHPGLIVAALAWCAAEAFVAGLRRHLDETDSAWDVLKRHGLYAMVACVAGVAFNDPARAVRTVGLIGMLAVVQVLTSAVLRSSGMRNRLGITTPSVLIVADRSTAVAAVADRAGLRSSSIVGVCLVDGVDRLSTVAGVPVLGTAADVSRLARDLRVHEVAVRLETPLDNDWLRELAWSLESLGTRLTLVTKLRNTAAHRVRVSQVGSSIVLSVAQGRPTGLVRWAKSAAETIAAAVGFLIALPVLLICAVAVKLDSPGPAFFQQTRVRDGDRTFQMLKLRTMRVDAEALRSGLTGSNDVGGGLFKMKVDPRVTRVGRVLRKLSLDEMPQLLNILRGEMSLVGPRPALPSEVVTYDRSARRRLDVKPGLTGLWQVSGRSRLSWDESVALDIDYVDNWRPGRDLRIAAATVRAVVRRDGAY